MNATMNMSKSADISLRTSALVAGLGLVLMTILAPIADVGIFGQLVIPGDAANTANNLVASAARFRIGLALFLIVALDDVVVAWALYEVFKPVNKSLSLLTAWLRVVYATILVFALSHLLNVLQFVNGSAYLEAFATEQLSAQVMIALNAFRDSWDLGLLILGLHLLLLGYVAVKSSYIPRILGILVIVSGLGYTIDGVGKVLSPTYALSFAAFTFFGEVLLGLWLLWRGIKGFDKASEQQYHQPGQFAQGGAPS